MKLVFLCSSLAPGHDGVGDYVRQLAGACTDAGHVCLLVALHDRHLSAAAGWSRLANEVRLGSTLSWSRRAEVLSDLLRAFDPDWISWQLVPYGFHPKGILPAGVFALLEAARPWPNHVMLHELWLGLARSDRFRPRLVGALQRRQLLAFLRRLGPAFLHTTNPAYQLALARQGWPSELLPLFGNIPVVAVSAETARAELAALVAAENLGPQHLGVIFGTVHPQWQPAPTLAWLRAAAAHSSRSLALFAVGRIGGHGVRLLDELRRTQPDLRVFSVGPQPPERISRLLQAAAFGLATHPWALIEKSGSTAALLEHGLPVLVPRDDWTPRDGAIVAAADSRLRRLDDLPPAQFEPWLHERRPPCSRLPALAARFLAQLNAPPPRGALVA